MLILKKVLKQMQKRIGNLFSFFGHEGCVGGGDIFIWWLIGLFPFFLFLPSMALTVRHLVIVMLLIYGSRSFDESTWGAFDNNDDVDSVWGFNTKTKVSRAIHSF